MHTGEIKRIEDEITKKIKEIDKVSLVHIKKEFPFENFYLDKNESYLIISYETKVFFLDGSRMDIIYHRKEPV